MKKKIYFNVIIFLKYNHYLNFLFAFSQTIINALSYLIIGVLLFVHIMFFIFLLKLFIQLLLIFDSFIPYSKLRHTNAILNQYFK